MNIQGDSAKTYYVYNQYALEIVFLLTTHCVWNISKLLEPFLITTEGWISLKYCLLTHNECIEYWNYQLNEATYRPKMFMLKIEKDPASYLSCVPGQVPTSHCDTTFTFFCPCSLLPHLHNASRLLLSVCWPLDSNNMSPHSASSLTVLSASG